MSWRGRTRKSETFGRTSVHADQDAESAALAVPQLTGCPGLLGQTLQAPGCATSHTRDEPPNRFGPDGRLRCGCEAPA